MNQQQMLRQARQLQAQLAKVQEQLGAEMVAGTSGGGAVEVVLDGHGGIRSVKIKPEAVDPADVETLEDLLVAALKDAQANVAQLSQSKLGPLAGGLGIPGL